MTLKQNSKTLSRSLPRPRQYPPEQPSDWPNLRWNFGLGVANGAFFALHDVLVNPSLVLVAFLAHLTDDPFVLGTTAPLWLGGLMISQFFVSERIQARRCSLPVYRYTTLVRALMWLGLVIVTLTSRDSTVLILMLLGFLVIYPITWGVAAIAFQDVVGKTIPPRRRGAFFSWRMMLGGIMAIAGSEYVNRVLDERSGLGFADNFALIFASAGVVTIIAATFFHFVREPLSERQPFHRSKGLGEAWATVRRIWRSSPRYRRYVQARIALMVAVGIAPLVLSYAKDQFSLDLVHVPLLLFADTVARLVTFAVTARLSPRWGDRLLARIAMVFGMAAFLMVIFAGPLGVNVDSVVPYFVVVFVLMAVYGGTIQVTMFAMNLNIAPKDEFPLYVGLSNTLLGIALYVSSAQGALVGWIGYAGLFVVGLGFVGFGWWMFTRIQDPVLDEALD